MPQTINTNIISLDAQRNLNNSQSSLAVSMQRLSSGLRVNSAKDDAAGLAIATRMDSQVRGMNVAVRNANDGISLAQTAESALGAVTNALQRMRELAVQASNSTNSGTDKDSLSQEFQQLGDEIQRVLGGTTFNGALTFQIGANTTVNDTLTVTTVNMAANVSITAVTSGGANAKIDSTVNLAGMQSVITALDGAIDTVNAQRATFGATQSRFESIITNLQSASQNQAAARSRIMDADFAAETANLSRAQVLQQAGNAMVAQANQLPQQVLSLLKN
jgi:flagellin